MDKTLVTPGHGNLLNLVSLVLVVGQQKFQIVQTSNAVDGAESRENQNQIILTVGLTQPQYLYSRDVISDRDLHLEDIRLNELSTCKLQPI